MNDLTMGQRIAEERKKLGLSQEALGEKTGVSRQAISKWESDAAVPEIDKLIALSKLFGVSVGWLLGVEERGEQRSEELSETQLKMVEEIVQRYQPKPQSRKKKVLHGILVLVLLVLTVAATVWFVRDNDLYSKNLFGNITSLRQENVEIQSRLDEITQRLESMGRDTLLTDYKMELLEVSPALEPDIPEREFNVSLGTATIQTDFQVTFARLSITALPQTRQEGDEAWLAVFLKGREITTVPLSWYENAYRTQFVLPVSDGYEYCFILDREGVQQMQYLKNTSCERLEEMTDPTFTMFAPGSITYNDKNLMIENFSYSFYLSDFGMESRWDWEKIDLVLTVNGEEMGRIEDGPWCQPEDGVSPGGLMTRAVASFPAPDLQEGDDIRLYIDAKLSSGITAKVWLLSVALVDGKIEYGIIAN